MIPNDPVFEAHRKLGFPPLPEAVQAHILLYADYKPVQDLVPDLRYPFPADLVRHYITISRDTFMAYLKDSDCMERNQTQYLEHPQRDGMWIRNTADGYELIWQERGHIDEAEEFTDLNSLQERLCDLLYQQFGNK